MTLGQIFAQYFISNLPAYMDKLKLDFWFNQKFNGSFEVLGKPGFCPASFLVFTGQNRSRTDHERNIGMFDHLKTLGRFYPIVLDFGRGTD
jgi:hypothetical protein